MSRGVTARDLARESLRLAAAFLAVAIVVSFVLGLLARSASTAALVFGATLGITLAAGLPIYLLFRVFGPLTLRRAMLAGAIAAIASAIAAIGYDQRYDPVPMNVKPLGTLVLALVVAGLGALGGCGFYLANRLRLENSSDRSATLR